MIKPVTIGCLSYRDTLSDQGMFSQNDVLSCPCLGTCDKGTPVM